MKKLLFALVAVASLSGCARYTVADPHYGYYYDPYYHTYVYHEHYIYRHHYYPHPHVKR